MEPPPSLLPSLFTRVPSLRALRHPGYRSIWIGSLISNIGTWMETIGVGIYVSESTHSSGWTGTVAALMFLPTTVLAPLGGAFADRFDRRRYVAGLTLVQTALAVALAVLAFTHTLSVPAVMVVVFFGGCTGALLNPAFSAVLADSVPQEDLLSAISLSSAQYNLGRFIGPALAAAVMAAGGVGWAFGINALSFGAVLWAVSVVQVAPPDPGQRESLWVNIRGGLDAARADPAIRAVLVMVGGVAFFVAPFIGLLPAFAINVLHRGATGTSLLVTCQGSGAVFAALFLGSLTNRWGSGKTFAFFSIGVGAVGTVYWLAPTYGWAAPALFLLGGCYLSMLSSASTACQSRVTRMLRGRVSALYSMVLNGAYSVGLIVLGTMGDKVGLRQVMVAAAGIFTLAVVAVRWRRPALFALLDAPPVRSEPRMAAAPPEPIEPPCAA